MTKILIADDEPDLLEIIAMELELADFETISVDCGRDAIEVLRKDSSIDAVLSDIRMPNGTGTDILEDLITRNYKIPMIFMSGFSDITKESALASGAYAYFNKPTNMQNVISKLKNVTKPIHERWGNKKDATAAISPLKLAFSSYEEAKTAEAISLGIGGFLFKDGQNALREGDILDFEIPIKEGETLIGQGIVQWQSQGPSGAKLCGIEFDYLTSDSMKLYHALVAQKPLKPYIPHSF